MIFFMIVLGALTRSPNRVSMVEWRPRRDGCRRVRCGLADGAAENIFSPEGSPDHRSFGVPSSSRSIGLSSFMLWGADRTRVRRATHVVLLRGS